MERVLRCKRCRKEYSLSDLRLLGNNEWVCRGCLAGHPLTDRSPVLQAVTKSPEQKREAPREYKTYKCLCGYQFQKKIGAPVGKCPYCGRGADAFVKEASVQDLLDGTEE